MERVKLRALITPGASIRGTIASGVSLGAHIEKGGGAPAYSGEYTVTPSDDRQTLDTANRTLNQAVVIEPIPSNYGRIAYSGSGLLVY